MSRRQRQPPEPQQPEPPQAGLPHYRNAVRPVDRVHPTLVNLMDMMNTVPPGDPDRITESALVNGIQLAIEMADPQEQVAIVPRIMSAEDLAQERLERPQVMDVEQTAILSPAEIGLLLRNTPGPQFDELYHWGIFHGVCASCLEQDATVRLGCNCAYCLPCLRAFLRVQLRQTGVFPPRCCNRDIDEQTVRWLRRPGLVHLYRQREAEAEIPAGQHLFCHDGACNTFIPPHYNGRCPICQQETCVSCRGPQHPTGFQCDAGEVVEDVWETMDKNGLVNCPRCGSIVQLGQGCNHITCTCRAEFCYLCGRFWGEPCCPVWGGEDRRIPIADRPGNKPERFRRQILDREQPPERRIQQLRVVPGEVVYPVEWPTRTPESLQVLPALPGRRGAIPALRRAEGGNPAPARVVERGNRLPAEGALAQYERMLQRELRRQREHERLAEAHRRAERRRHLQEQRERQAELARREEMARNAEWLAQRFRRDVPGHRLFPRMSWVERWLEEDRAWRQAEDRFRFRRE